MSIAGQTWDPNMPGINVRVRANPGVKGVTTGKVRGSGSRRLVQIQLGPDERSYKPYDLLEMYETEEDVFGLIENLRFSNPDELRRILTIEKLKGMLTNVYYSMESSRTEFFPHQFKPVLKFLESPVGRLLIADEVGLGKTIEATYIWKELQARADAKRLLIVCPAILREKWKDNIYTHFNIEADIVNAKELLERLKRYLQRPDSVGFRCIASLEGLRPGGKWQDEENDSPRAEFARLIEANPTLEERSLFDLAIVDEAHYLRNPTTATHALGQLLRDSALHFILLTATPIQIHSSNLFELLRLLDPEAFFDKAIFEETIAANLPINDALRYLWSNPPNFKQAKQQIDRALQSKYFAGHAILQDISQKLAAPETIDDEQRVRFGRKLEAASLVGQYLTRSRKRHVIANRVARSPQTLKVSFSDTEREIYDRVTQAIRQQAKGQSNASLFRLVARQRQMASSLPAAIAAWRDSGVDRSGTAAESSLWWEDFGRAIELDARESASQTSVDIDVETAIADIDLRSLEAEDTKYDALITFLKQEIETSSSEKFVIFSYFRATLHYLQRRLRADGLSVELIIRGMGDKKWSAIERFRDDSVSVLLSSEVGSEGIDLQFCRVLVNYDLPWNPMKVEQRIGRLDRLGQKAERISIVHFSQQDTIEARILERLYERINVFRESIGDLEDILGDTTQHLLMPLLDPQLSDEERDRKAAEIELSLVQQRQEQERLEREAINMLAFSDQILDVISDSRDRGRWIHPEEIEEFVAEFLKTHFSTTEIVKSEAKPFACEIRLSDIAKSRLSEFMLNHRISTSTLLTSMSVECLFDPRAIDPRKHLPKRTEIIEPTHPLVAWICHFYREEAPKYHPAIAISIESSAIDLAPGLYAFAVQYWGFIGLRKDIRLAFQVCSVEDLACLLPRESETAIATAARCGERIVNSQQFAPDRDRIVAAVKYCDTRLNDRYDEYYSEFDSENQHRCDVQLRSAKEHFDRRSRDVNYRLQTYRESGRTRMIPALEGQLSKLQREFELKCRAIARKRSDVTLDLDTLTAGIILVRESKG
ncbi:MAG: SNF2-related protein [Cyanobacteria bacterium J06639_1]